MPKFIVLKGSIKKTVDTPDGKKRHHMKGDILELSVEDAALINKKTQVVELAETHAAKDKAKLDAKAAIEKADKDAKAKLDTKGGGK